MMARFIVNQFFCYCLCACFTLFFLTGARCSKNVHYNNKPIAFNEVSHMAEETKMKPPVLKYSKGKHGATHENAGQTPLRSVILTTWRTGSSFLGAILNSVPGDFYHFEPLAELGDVQVRGPPHAKMALKQLKKLLTCDYSDLNSYFHYVKESEFLLRHNTRWWKECTSYKPNQCYNATHIEEFCKKSPFQSLKTVRLRLKLADQLLNDESLKVRIVLLVRDPRAVLESRRKTLWCKHSPDCIDPQKLCADMVSDYDTASKFLVKYPDTFTVLRYEDFTQDTLKGSKEMLEFLGISSEFHPAVEKFLKTHTTKNIGTPYSTYRLTKETPFHWMKEMSFEYLDKIQSACSKAMSNWGYIPARNADHLLSKDFNPVGKYNLP